MALAITGLTRRGGAGCNHFRIQVTEDGVVRNVDLHLDEVRDALESLPWPAPVALAIMRLAYHRRRGGNAQALVGVEIGEIP